MAVVGLRRDLGAGRWPGPVVDDREDIGVLLVRARYQRSVEVAGGDVEGGGGDGHGLRESRFLVARCLRSLARWAGAYMLPDVLGPSGPKPGALDSLECSLSACVCGQRTVVRVPDDSQPELPRHDE